VHIAKVQKKTDTRLATHDRDIQMIQTAVCELQKARALMPDDQHSSVPFSERTQDIMGGLGWDSERSLVEERRRQVLAAAEVDGAGNKELKAQFNTGSAAEISFVAVDAL
jgi:ABC-type hemin transport system ATPase subunit